VTTTAAATPEADQGTRNRRVNAWTRFARDRFAVGCVVVLVLVLAESAVLGMVAPATATDPSPLRLNWPSWSHLLGTDELGRSIAYRLLAGAQPSLLVALGSAARACLIGSTLGLLAGYLGGWLDVALMRLMDLLLAIPIFLVALVVVVVLGPSTTNVIIAIAVPNIPVFARVARASTLELRSREYVLAARAMGARRSDVMVRTILPNIMGPQIVQLVVTAASAVVVAASLNYLGLGVPPPAPSWGSMLQASQSYLLQNPWYGVIPGIALAATVLLLGRIGSAVQQATGGAPSATRKSLRARR
jgi:peptide/nickel transport system permease protein